MENNQDRMKSVERLTDWIRDLMEKAKNDVSMNIAWFDETKDKPFSIVAGWEGGFSEDFADIFCISKSDPEYAMCIKVAKNEGPYAYIDYESMNMPIDPVTGEVDDTSIPLEWEDNPEIAAHFFYSEWERITEEYGGAQQ